jgi:hypothetical protein
MDTVVGDFQGLAQAEPSPAAVTLPTQLQNNIERLRAIEKITLMARKAYAANPHVAPDGISYGP